MPRLENCGFDFVRHSLGVQLEFILYVSVADVRFTHPGWPLVAISAVGPETKCIGRVRPCDTLPLRRFRVSHGLIRHSDFTFQDRFSVTKIWRNSTSFRPDRFTECVRHYVRPPGLCVLAAGLSPAHPCHRWPLPAPCLPWRARPSVHRPPPSAPAAAPDL